MNPHGYYYYGCESTCPSAGLLLGAKRPCTCQPATGFLLCAHVPAHLPQAGFLSSAKHPRTYPCRRVRGIVYDMMDGWLFPSKSLTSSTTEIRILANYNQNLANICYAYTLSSPPILYIFLDSIE